MGRFVTWADDTDLRGKCYEHATLISFNDYPGWYNHQGDLASPGKYCPRPPGAAKRP
jgi:hypothetical protein